jgi:hypothetical protein
VTVFLGWIALIVVNLLAGLILGAIGIAGAGLFG